MRVVKFLLCLCVAAFVAADDAEPADTFTAEQRASIESSQEKHEFQAEVSRLMDIIINSLYTNRDIFLRELISNAADALDKVRFLSLTDESIMKANPDLEIRIQADVDGRTVTITDTGVGMTREDLQKNLGVVAKSGTTEFLDAAAAAKGSDDQLSLIGQFGVGFYSVYLVADKVTVISKNHNDDQYIWESNAKNSYTIAKDPRGNTLGRGTSIILHLKDDAGEFLETRTLERLATHYSSFIDFPIMLHEIEEVEKEVPVEVDEEAEEEEKPEKSEDDDDDEVEITDDEDEAEKEPKTETILEEVESWKKVNDVQPLWTRTPSDVSDDEYKAFFKTFTGGRAGDEYLEKIHFVAEGEISFRALLYIPKTLDRTVLDKYYDKKTNVKLYVRRVLISDTFEDLLPNYLSFVHGVIDSDDLPLNVNRETLAQSKVLKVMAKKLTRKVLEMLRKIAERSEEEEEDAQDEEADEDEDPEDRPKSDYINFWEGHSKLIKMGVMDDSKHKSKLTKLLRFKTSHSNGRWISLEDYVDRMQEDQKKIWYLTGETMAKIEANPVLEGFAKRDLEVILLNDAIDEFFIQYIHEVDGMEPANAGKGGEAPWDLSKAYEAHKVESEDFANWAKDVLGDAVKTVVHSAKLVNSAAVIGAGQYSITGGMERVQKAQTLNEQAPQKAERNFEFNWRHPIIKEIARRAAENAEDEVAKDMLWVLYQSAQIYSGYLMDDGEDFANRINRIVAKGLNVDPDAQVDAEEDDDDDEDEEEDVEDDGEVEADDDVEDDVEAEV